MRAPEELDRDALRATAANVLRDEQISADRLTPYYTPPAARNSAPAISEIVRYLNTWVAFKDPLRSTGACATC